MGSYVPTTAAEREQMLAQVGVKSLNDLYAAVPQEMFLHNGLNLPEGLSELEVREKVTDLAEKNKVFKTVLRGAGSYRHFIPAVVKSITSREAVSYTHLRAHETGRNLVCRLLLEKKKNYEPTRQGMISNAVFCLKKRMKKKKNKDKSS